MRPKSSRREAPKPISLSVCYCDGKRELGKLELFCASCRKWFHGRCLKDLKEFYGLPFMVCYVFNCTECSPTKKESWTPRQANFAHMCVTVLANLTCEAALKRAEAKGESLPDGPLSEPIYFSFETDILPYFDAQWENLTSMQRRVKNTWHQTLLKSLSKETLLFESSADGQSFALRERDLLTIGPVHEALRQIGRSKPSSSVAARDAVSEQIEKFDDSDGPKTRGSSKRRNLDGGANAIKKPKFTADYSSTRIAGIASPIDFPFNREGYRYYLVEKDDCAPYRDVFDEDNSGKPIPGHTYRVVTHPTVTISPNDRAYQLKMSEDRFSVSGFEGYCVARATHSVSHGTWYFEVIFLSQPPESHIRIGWSQALAPVQTCLGYNSFSYSWRSHKGTAFHQAKGKHYATGGYKEGDVLGCLISLPPSPGDKEYNFAGVTELPPSTSYLPASHKDLPLINFKHNYFYEEKDEVQQALKNLKPSPGSYIEFFRNGVSCGVAFRDINEGFYFPSVSLFQGALVRCNFGPRFKCPLPRGARPMCARVREQEIEQCLSDILFFVENEKMIADEAMGYTSR